MALVTLNIDKLKENYIYLDKLFKRNSIQWSVVTKLLCGNQQYLKAVLDLGIKQVCDSRLANLRVIKAMAPHVETIFIKPAAKRNAEKIIEFADISFHTSIATIQAISDAARKVNKVHKIVIMIESGELREGVVQHELIHFYGRVLNMPNIKVIGLGTNLTCMNGILPSHGKLKRLEYYKKLIEEQYGTTLPILSGGASVTIPLIFQNQLPESINHFRVGETLFFGTDVYNNSIIPDMHHHLFTLYGEIIELHRKPNTPSGNVGYNLAGNKVSIEPSELDSNRAIIDIGLLDIESRHIEPIDGSIKVVGASSDMTVLDLGENANQYKVGDKVSFTMDYMGALRVMHSKYIEKKIEKSTLLYRSAYQKKEQEVFI